MASIRRSQSPFPNGAAPFSVQSPSHKHLSSSPLSKFLATLLFSKPPRKSPPWKQRCLLFFLLGFLLGIAPFDHFYDIEDSSLTRLAFETSQDTNYSHTHTNHFFIKPQSLTSPVDNNNYNINEDNNYSADVRKELIVVTPTYARGMQSYYLNRLGQVLRLVRPPLLWIVVEMSVESMETADILRRTGVMYRHLVWGGNSTDVKDRGVHQRNRALEHIELHKLHGIVYFADDDNVYSLELFETLRNISRFGTWPVAMLAQSKNKAVLEGPVCSGSQVVGWHTNEKSKRLRRFHVDMSGFAFNSTILWDPKRWKRPTSNPVRQLDSVKEGFQETTFIEQVVEDERQMEGIPHGCSKIMNWHLHLDSRELDYPKGWVLQKNLDVILPAK